MPDRLWHPPPVSVRASLALTTLLAGGLVGACQSANQAPTSTDAQAEVVAEAVAEVVSPGQAEVAGQDEASPRLELRFRPPVGTAWVEEVVNDLFSHLSDELPPESPTLRTTRRERFAVLAAEEGVHRVEVTLSAIRMEPAQGPVFDSREDGAAPTNPLVLDHLSFVGLPLVYRLSDAAATLEIEDPAAYRSAADRRHAALREEAGLPPPTPEEEAQWRMFLDTELKKPLEWGLRPLLPTRPVRPGDEWTQEVQTSTLFNATARWPIRQRIEAVSAGLVTIHRDADAEFVETPAMKRFIKRADATLEGAVVVDVTTGALVRTETTVTGMVEAAAQPEAGFAGGTLKMRSITKRARLEEAGAGADAEADAEAGVTKGDAAEARG